jgi:hypothetical protein
MESFRRARHSLPRKGSGEPGGLLKRMIRSSVRLFWMALCSLPVVAQTQVDLRTQSKNVDFQAAAFTKPFKSGAVLPLTCTQAELFFLTSATPETNVFGCPNGGWTSEGAGALSRSRTLATRWAHGLSWICPPDLECCWRLATRVIASSFNPAWIPRSFRLAVQTNLGDRYYVRRPGAPARLIRVCSHRRCRLTRLERSWIGNAM